MRVGIFSDTHANYEALCAVVQAFEKERIDRYVCLGDTVGYGGSPNECCDVIRDIAAFTILGNHDAAVAGRMDYSYYYDAARQALDFHAEVLSTENMDWLKSLRDAAAAATGVDRPVFAIDGKTARRSHDRKNGLGALHCVSVWASEYGLSLGQVACAEKANEITAIPELLRLVDIQGAIITIDAMGTQRAPP